LNSIELLTANLLQNQQKLDEIDYWLKVMNRPQGWHYDMDIIWLLKGLKEDGIKPGSTILDAGAGLGITQFLLAAQGFNVISLDFTPRNYPLLARGIFQIDVDGQDNIDYEHNYMKFIKYGQDQPGNNLMSAPSLPIKIWRALQKRPRYLFGRLMSHYYQKENLQLNKIEQKKNHSGFGTIKFLRAAFHKIPIEDGAVDALVSVSAIEHADHKLLSENINEMKRVVKLGNTLRITTSATAKSYDWFHDKTNGWCFSKKTLKRMAGIDTETFFNYNAVEKNIVESSLWRSRVDSYYANDKESDFYRRKVQRLPYLPVGIKIINE